MAERRRGTTPLRGRPIDENGAIQFDYPTCVVCGDYLMACTCYEEFLHQEVPMAEITLENVHESMIYHAPDEQQKIAHQNIAAGAEAFARIILENAPRCPDRSVAIRKVREARMDANSAVANRGCF